MAPGAGREIHTGAGTGRSSSENTPRLVHIPAVGPWGCFSTSLSLGSLFRKYNGDNYLTPKW